MAKLDFAKAKADISEIVEIVKTVPEALQQRCFELLFERAFSETEASVKPGGAATPAEEPTPPGASDKKLPSNVVAFMRRHNIPDSQLGKLFMIDHDPLLPVYKIPTGQMAKSQLIKVLMVILENGLLNNSLTATYAELRGSARDDDLYDGNFNKLFRKDLFKGVGKDGVNDDTVIELTGTGMDKLAEVIKELGQ
ncbi:hypothetical protein FJN17_26830 [Bradyrhizobium symbiodeficiens]|uniref:Uncharacterized protein n=1 Tax=Bradyrhizobium symbiodeficiens TaxID=1404367 RepID=A0ABX5WCS0_9BRAD|nr:hypothetical protein [Bradyrhizobium symbiodeficiens]QDF40893.1 hypothetical protein FJN17_26830 [Bradyrhizobium symbiodeficiens]